MYCQHQDVLLAKKKKFFLGLISLLIAGFLLPLHHLGNTNLFSFLFCCQFRTLQLIYLSNNICYVIRSRFFESYTLFVMFVFRWQSYEENRKRQRKRAGFLPLAENLALFSYPIRFLSRLGFILVSQMSSIYTVSFAST